MNNPKVFILHCLASLFLLAACEISANNELLIVLSFTPLFRIMETEREKNWKEILLKLGLIFVMLLLWQLYALRWLVNTGIQVPIILAIYYSLSLLLPFAVFYNLSRFSNPIRWGAFCLLWITLEIIHSESELGIPIQSLGYYLHTAKSYIQWYAYSGFIGGTLLVILLNILLAKILNYFTKATNTIKPPMVILALVSVLIIIFPDHPQEVTNDTIKVGVLHTNLNPRGEKYEISTAATAARYASIINNSTPKEDLPELTVLPENAMPFLGWYANLGSNSSETYFDLAGFQEQINNSSVLTGGILYEQNRPGYSLNTHISNSHYAESEDIHYYVYNAAMLYQFPKWEVRTKRELVPFEEYVPKNKVASLLVNTFESLGAFGFSAREKFIKPLKINRHSIGPIICYESAKYQSVNEIVLSGATLLAMIYNEGWYNSDKGAGTFQKIATIRAIETGRDIAKSSNLGYSGKISANGHFTGNDTNRQKDAFLIDKYELHRGLTFFVKNGEQLYFYIKLLGLLGILSLLITNVLKR